MIYFPVGAPYALSIVIRQSLPSRTSISPQNSADLFPAIFTGSWSNSVVAYHPKLYLLPYVPLLRAMRTGLLDG